MFDHLFENRNTTVTHLLKLGDCLGRSLRENTELFSIDSEKKEVAYLTESNKVLTGKYDLHDDISLTNIKVQEADLFSDNEVFDTYVNECVTSFVGELTANRYPEADNSFTDILSLWENRLKFENVKKRLLEKASSFSENQQILNTSQFQRFLEVMPQVTQFLQEEKETIQKVEEIENAIKLSNSVSKAFNFPRISYETLEENNEYIIAKGLNKSVYELICKQELVKKELLESKKNFEDVWATNPKIRQVASLIFDDSDETVLETLVEAVVEVPYLALTTKKQLFESMNNAFSLTDGAVISTKELKTYVSKLFEMKKPLKQVIISLLNEKYGINIQNLKETATFKGLANTQVVIFEALARLAPKGSVIKDTLSDISEMLKTKNGVEVIDINELLQDCFEECGYDSFCKDFTIIEGISFENILSDEVSVVDLLEKAKERLLFDKFKKGEEDQTLSVAQQKGRDEAEKMEKYPESDREEEDDSVKTAEKNGKSHECDKVHPDETHKAWKKTQDKDEMSDPGQVESNEDVAVEEAPVLSEEGEEAPSDESSEESSEEPPLTKEEFLDALSDMDELIKGMSDSEEEPEEDAPESDETEN